MILLQVVMVSPGTHFVKNHESQSRTNELQLKNASPLLKMHEPLCNQTFNLKTDSKTLYYSILKLKYSPSIGEVLFTFSASFTYAHHYLMKLIK